MEHDISKLSERLNESNQVRKHLDEDLHDTVRAMQEQESKIQNERNELQFMIRETVKLMERATAEKESVQIKTEDTQARYNEIYSENEQMLMEFEDTKLEIEDTKKQKTHEIETLLDKKQDLDEKLQSAYDQIARFEANIDESNNQYSEMKDSLEADIKSVHKK
jgi:chromosome segregation ATPase